MNLLHTYLCLSILIFMNGPVHAVQPPKWQALEECAQAKKLAEVVADLKNKGATKSDMATVRAMASDGEGIMGDLTTLFFEKHRKGTSADKFSLAMHARCMRSNGY